MRSRSAVVDCASIAVVHAAACVAVRFAGFDHVSDDDFARVTIAQAFAHAPKLDPSGTSWLPFPFWALGSAMIALGRSLEVARAFSIAIASAAATLPYLALRRAGAPRAHAIAALAFALLSPWGLWLGAATVPESMTASAVAAAAIALVARGAQEHRAHGAPPSMHRRSHDEIVASSARREAVAIVMWAVALACACLSRYEAWPAAAVIATAVAMRARSPKFAVASFICVAGPIAWMAWNAHAHDGPFHFFRRVSSFKQAIGAGSTDTIAALLLYPRLLATTRPDVVFATAFALPFLRRPDIRRRWLVPLLCALAELAFLAIGNARDGAPAHHPERALLGVVILLALFAADVLATIARRHTGPPRRIAMACLALVAAAWLVSLRPLFGGAPSDDRASQLARGRELRGADHLVIEPCAFEHFALLAAFGAPERAELLPRTNAPVTTECPRVER